LKSNRLVSLSNKSEFLRQNGLKIFFSSGEGSAMDHRGSGWSVDDSISGEKETDGPGFKKK
jgi:hypothetical protein